jgi:hypothetical protein
MAQTMYAHVNICILKKETKCQCKMFYSSESQENKEIRKLNVKFLILIFLSKHLDKCTYNV